MVTARKGQRAHRALGTGWESHVGLDHGAGGDLGSGHPDDDRNSAKKTSGPVVLISQRMAMTWGAGSETRVLVSPWPLC